MTADLMASLRLASWPLSFHGVGVSAATSSNSSRTDSQQNPYLSSRPDLTRHGRPATMVQMGWGSGDDGGCSTKRMRRRLPFHGVCGMGADVMTRSFFYCCELPDFTRVRVEPLHRGAFRVVQQHINHYHEEQVVVCDALVHYASGALVLRNVRGIWGSFMEERGRIYRRFVADAPLALDDFMQSIFEDEDYYVHIVEAVRQACLAFDSERIAGRLALQFPNRDFDEAVTLQLVDAQRIEGLVAGLDAHVATRIAVEALQADHLVGPSRAPLPLVVNGDFLSTDDPWYQACDNLRLQAWPLRVVSHACGSWTAPFRSPARREAKARRLYDPEYEGSEGRLPGPVRYAEWSGLDAGLARGWFVDVRVLGQEVICQHDQAAGSASASGQQIALPEGFDSDGYAYTPHPADAVHEEFARTYGRVYFSRRLECAWYYRRISVRGVHGPLMP